jgi:glycerol-3-phosphate dehydrogenase
MHAVPLAASARLRHHASMDIVVVGGGVVGVSCALELAAMRGG